MERQLIRTCGERDWRRAYIQLPGLALVMLGLEVVSMHVVFRAFTRYLGYM